MRSFVKWFQIAWFLLRYRFVFCKTPVQRWVSLKTNSSFEEKLVTNTLTACLAQFKVANEAVIKRRYKGRESLNKIKALQGLSNPRLICDSAKKRMFHGFNKTLNGKNMPFAVSRKVRKFGSKKWPSSRGSEG